LGVGRINDEILSNSIPSDGLRKGITLTIALYLRGRGSDILKYLKQFILKLFL
jgi:hypothetical protein